MIWFPASQLLATPLTKVPLLLTAARLTALAMTPPTSPPSSEETKGYQGVEDPMKPLLSRSGYIYKNIYRANAICESAVILAQRYPSAVSEIVLSYLIRDSLRASNNIRVTPWWLAGCLAMTAGSLLRLACYHTLGRFFTWELSLKKGHSLVTAGPYSIVRHPSYVGSTLIGVGVVLCHFGPGSWYAECVGWETWGSILYTTLWGAWSLAVPVLLCARAPTEDRILQKEFGVEWETYAKRTPYRLIPYVY